MKNLSFIIPMYNAGKYVGDCLRSILNQGLSREDFEIIVVDDGSTDDSKDVVLKYKEVTYIYQKNNGQASARNVGLAQATGQYVCFVDSDDMLVPNSIGVVLEKAIEYNLDVLTYDFYCTENYSQDDNCMSDVISGEMYIGLNNYSNAPWWYISKRESVGDLRFVEGRYVEDAMFTMELLMKVKRVAHINRCCYHNIVRQGSTMTRKDESHMRKMIADYLFCYHYMQDLIKKYRVSLSADSLNRCEGRSESFLFFLLIRLMRFPNGNNLIKEVINEMKNEGLYPVNRLSKKDYPGFAFSAMHIIVNRPWLLIGLNRIYKVLGRL